MDRFAELAAFVRTVDRGSQAAAARELGVTPAMVGRYIRALEDRLGARLLNRTTTTQSLTEAGAALHARAIAVLEQLEAAEDVVADRQAEPRGILRVSAPMSFGVRYLAAAVAGFGAQHPELRVELAMNDRVVDLVDEGYDLALRIGRLADSSLIARRLAPCRVVACAAPAYLARHGPPAHPTDLRRHDCLLYAYAAGGAVWRFHGADGHETQVEVGGTFVANNGDAVLAAAIEGAGVLMQPSFIVGDALRDGRLVRVLPDWGLPELTINAVYPSARHLSPKVRRFVDFLAARFAGEPVWDRGLRPPKPDTCAG
jgi:DNA-binding transcriptional LysR family regulator